MHSLAEDATAPRTNARRRANSIQMTSQYLIERERESGIRGPNQIQAPSAAGRARAVILEFVEPRARIDPPRNGSRLLALVVVVARTGQVVGAVVEEVRVGVAARSKDRSGSSIAADSGGERKAHS